MKKYCHMNNPNKTDKRKIVVTCDYCGCERTSKDLMKRHMLYKHHRKNSFLEAVKRELDTVSSPSVDDLANLKSDQKKLMKSLQKNSDST